MLEFIPILISYLLGAIPFGLIISRIAGIEDIRKTGSGNIGATNVWRAAGFKVALYVFIGDIGKGVVAVLLAKYFSSNFYLNFFSPDFLFVMCAVAAVLGHVFPIYLGFKGGKGVNTALGAMIVLLPIETVISFVVFLLVVIIFKYVSLGSMMAAVTLLIIIIAEKYYMNYDIASIYFYLAVVLVVMIIITHRQNISRLLSGTENKFSFSSKSKRGDENV